MAEPKPSPTGRKRPQTVRERSQTVEKPKAQPVRSTARQVRRPIRAVAREVKFLLRPFRFVLRPFKTRPVRFVGRVLAKILLLNYFRSSWQELRAVTWPDRRNTLKLTVAVFTFAIIFGAIIATADYGLDKLFRKVLLN